MNNYYCIRLRKEYPLNYKIHSYIEEDIEFFVCKAHNEEEAIEKFNGWCKKYNINFIKVDSIEEVYYLKHEEILYCLI